MSRSLELLSEVCAALPHTARKMFGGHGFFAPNGGMFAGIVTDDAVILKLQHGPVRDELLALGGHPWEWTGGGKPMTMREWIIVPEGFYDDLEEFAAWAMRAHQIVPAKVAKVKAKAPAKKAVEKAASAKKPARKPVEKDASPKKPARKPVKKEASAKRSPRSR